MILLDCGNNHLKAQWRQSDGIRASFVCNYDPNWPQRLRHWLRELPVDHCYLSSVLDPQRQQLLDECLQQQFGPSYTRFLSSTSAGGVINGYREPTRLGSDRWLAMIGAADLTDGDCLIIDAGSAITIDLLRADGQHLGGAILPGFNTSLDRFTQIFSYIDFDDPRISLQDEPGCSTEAAIHINYAQDSDQQLPDLVTRWSRRLDPNATMLFCGGDAYRVQCEIVQAGHIIPDLVFHGMALLVQQ